MSQQRYRVANDGRKPADWYHWAVNSLAGMTVALYVMSVAMVLVTGKVKYQAIRSVATVFAIMCALVFAIWALHSIHAAMNNSPFYQKAKRRTAQKALEQKQLSLESKQKSKSSWGPLRHDEQPNRPGSRRFPEEKNVEQTTTKRGHSACPLDLSENIIVSTGSERATSDKTLRNLSSDVTKVYELGSQSPEIKAAKKEFGKGTNKILKDDDAVNPHSLEPVKPKHSPPLHHIILQKSFVQTSHRAPMPLPLPLRGRSGSTENSKSSSGQHVLNSSVVVRLKLRAKEEVTHN